MANPASLKPFQKGDPRINRKGRPKSFDAYRALAQGIAHEEVQGKDGQPLVISGHIVTKVEAILRAWSQSKDPRLQMAFMEIAFGKVPAVTELRGEGGGPVTFRVIYERKRMTDGDSDNIT